MYKNLAFLTAIAGNYLLLSPLLRLLRKRYPCYALRDLDICIEGFPRSGNSFFVAAFTRWNPGAVVTHHTHLASNAKYSAKLGKPTVILLRAPEEALSSAIAWDNRLLPSFGLLNYICFYRALRRYRDGILFLDFNDAVKQPDRCVERINDRFGTDFKAFDFTEEENLQIRRELASHDVRKRRSELSSTLPNAQKDRLKSEIVPEIKRNWLYASARTVYAEYTALAATH